MNRHAASRSQKKLQDDFFRNHSHRQISLLSPPPMGAAKNCDCASAISIEIITGWWFGCHQFYFPMNINWESMIIPIDFHSIIFQVGVAVSNHQPVMIVPDFPTKTSIFPVDVPSSGQCPVEDLRKPEFAFFGQSNVGKSSMLNFLCSEQRGSIFGEG